jgi:hypothetical protein
MSRCSPRPTRAISASTASIAEREVPNRARNADKPVGQAVVVDLPSHRDKQGPLGGHKGERRSRDTERDVDARPQRAVNLDRPAAGDVK